MLFIFDMGGVVTNTFDITKVSQKLGISNDLFWKICKNGYENFWDEYQKGFIQTIDFWKKFNIYSKEYQIPEVKHDLFHLEFHPSKKTGTVDLILKLKKKHRVVCGTNTIESHYDNHLERGDYLFFNKTYASNKIQAIKPNLDFFELILDAEGYSPQESFFVDDKIENVNAAKSLGINAVLFESEEDLISKWEKYC